MYLTNGFFFTSNLLTSGELKVVTTDIAKTSLPKKNKTPTLGRNIICVPWIRFCMQTNFICQHLVYGEH